MDMYSKYIFMYLYGLYESDNHTFWLFNIAMENGPFIDDFPIKTSIYEGFSMAMLVINQRLILPFLSHGRSLTPSATHHSDRLRRRLNVDWTWSPNCTKVFCTGRWPFKAWKGKKNTEMVLCVGMERPADTYIVYMYIITNVNTYIHKLYVYIIKQYIYIYIWYMFIFKYNVIRYIYIYIYIIYINHIYIYILYNIFIYYNIYIYTR